MLINTVGAQYHAFQCSNHCCKDSREKPTFFSFLFVLVSAGDGERWEGACVVAVYEGSGQQGEHGCRIPADGVSPSVFGELPPHTALHPAHGWPPAAAIPPLYRHHGQWPGCLYWYTSRTITCVTWHYLHVAMQTLVFPMQGEPPRITPILNNINERRLFFS